MKKNLLLCSCLACIAITLSACGSDDSSDSPQDGGCSYTGSKCNDDGSALLSCNNGIESSKDCVCVDDKCQEDPLPPADKCNYTGSKCNDDGSALLSCNNGVESSKNCKCVDNACQEDPLPPADKCNYTGSKCNDDGSALLSCNNGVESSKDCVCVDDKCQEAPEVCERTDNVCDETGKNVIVCDPDTGKNHIVESCLGTCENGKCKDVACPDTFAPTCYDGHTKLVCANDTIVKEECGDSLFCKDGECFEGREEAACDFDKSCTSSNDGIRECIDGKVKYTACGNGKYCKTDAGTGAITCEDAIWTPIEGEEACDYATLQPYCDGNVVVSCNEDGSVKRQKCGAACVDAQCQSNRTIGGNCNRDTWSDTCIGNQQVTCSKKSIITVVKNCEEENSICGVILDNAIPSIQCVEKCENLGQVINDCIDHGVAESMQYECTKMDYGIGDGRMGYQYIAGSLQSCQFSCVKGKCVDYSEGIENYGKTCDTAVYKGYCKSSQIAVACESGSDGNHVIQAEKCNYDETCKVITSEAEVTAKCVQTCKPEDPAIYKCGALLGSQPISSKYTCQLTDDGTYSYQADGDYTLCKSTCVESTGKCQ